MARGITKKQARTNLDYIKSLGAHNMSRPSVQSAMRMYQGILDTKSKTNKKRGK